MRSSIDFIFMSLAIYGLLNHHDQHSDHDENNKEFVTAQPAWG